MKLRYIINIVLLGTSGAVFATGLGSNPNDLKKFDQVHNGIHSCPSCDLSGSSFELDTEFANSVLTSAILTKANFISANFSGSDFSHAQMGQIDALSADLSSSNFQNVNLINANLQEADLSRANFSGANTTGVDLSDADLVQSNITNQQLCAAKAVEGATMPDGSIIKDKATLSC